MSQRLLIICPGFDVSQSLLQPWRYFHEIAAHLANHHTVVLLTQGLQDALIQSPAKYQIQHTPFLTPSKSSELHALITALAPQKILWSMTPLSFAYRSVFSKLDAELYAVLTCPLYRATEVVRAIALGSEWSDIKTQVTQTLFPKIWLRRLLNSERVLGVITQSERNRARLTQHGVKPAKLHCVPVGMNSDEFPVSQIHPEPSIDTPGLKFLYLGSLKAVRGVRLLLKAFARCVGHLPNAQLTLLARGASAEKIDDFARAYSALVHTRQIRFVGGWLSREAVYQYLATCDVVVLPFLLVPSDVPIAMLEAMHAGKPVIVTDLDGLPEHVYQRGVVIKPAVHSLENALLECGRRRELRQEFSTAGSHYMKTYPNWSQVGDLVEQILFGSMR